MSKEEGHYVTLPEQQLETKLYNFEITFDSTLFLLTSSSLKGDNELAVVEILKGQKTPKVYSCTTDVILANCKVFPIFGKLFLCGFGYESASKIGKESIYFCQEFDINTRHEFKVKINGKPWKENIVDLDFIDDSVFFACEYQLCKYSLGEMKMEMIFEQSEKKPSGKFRKIQTDRKNRRIYVTRKNQIQVFDDTWKVVSTIDQAHELPIRSIDLNPNKQHQILSAAGEPFLKFWDLRNASQPNLVFNDPSGLVTSASFNKTYDQLVLYGTDNGSLGLYCANNVSSAVVLRPPDEPLPDNVIVHTYRSALDDCVDSLSWSYQDPWIFGAFARNKGYFDFPPQHKRLDVMY